MFGQKGVIETNQSQVGALLEPGCEFDGKLTFQGNVQINGHFMGEIFSEGTLVVGPKASIEARVEVGSIVIHGKVTGEIVAKDRIEMRNNAEVKGNISAKTLVIEEGVFFEGRCSMGMDVAPLQEERLHPVLSGKDDYDDEEELTQGRTSL